MRRAWLERAVRDSRPAPATPARPPATLPTRACRGRPCASSLSRRRRLEHEQPHEKHRADKQRSSVTRRTESHASHPTPDQSRPSRNATTQAEAILREATGYSVTGVQLLSGLNRSIFWNASIVPAPRSFS